jgi:hypothetical protein
MRLMAGSAFKMRLRQSEGLTASVITLMGLEISVQITGRSAVIRRPLIRSTSMLVSRGAHADQ